jgi:hypothetical protein
MGPNGGYYDQQDSGPDQYQPTAQEQAAVNPPAAPTMPQTSEGPGGISGRAQQPGFTPINDGPNIRGPRGSYPGVERPIQDPNAATDQGPYSWGGGTSIFPGRSGGGWSMNGGPSGGWASILQALQRMYGGQGTPQSTAGDFIPTAQRQQSPAFAGVPPAPATAKPPSGGGLGRSLGGALFGL